MRNTQPIEKRVRNPEGFLSVHSIFKTIQGEGPFCGTPCVFVRLAGCNLQCPACDTDYTSGRTTMGPYEILAQVNELWRSKAHRRGLVVITGGEPFRQDIAELLNVLTSHDYYVQIESNGTLELQGWQDLNINNELDKRVGVYVVCSPKTGKLHEATREYVSAYKYVVKHDDIHTDGLPLSALDHSANPFPARPHDGFDGPVYVQPLDSKDPEENKLHTDVAVALSLEHGYILQLQVHKYIGVE